MHHLLERLGWRGAVIGADENRTGSYSRNVNGWLTPAEKAELFACLDRLPLPRYAPTFAEMGVRYRRALIEVVRPRWLPPLDAAALKANHHEWMALSRSFVRTVAAIATEGGHGTLWGNDLPWLEDPVDNPDETTRRET